MIRIKNPLIAYHIHTGICFLSWTSKSLIPTALGLYGTVLYPWVRWGMNMCINVLLVKTVAKQPLAGSPVVISLGHILHSSSPKSISFFLAFVSPPAFSLSLESKTHGQVREPVMYLQDSSRNLYCFRTFFRVIILCVWTMQELQASRDEQTLQQKTLQTNMQPAANPCSSKENTRGLCVSF